LFEVPLYDAGAVIVEVDEEDDGIVRAGRPGEIAGQAAESLRDAWARIRPMAKAFAEEVATAQDGANEVCVEFGIKLTAEAGFVVAKAATEANFRVALTWKRP
jgi:hypothetical protein